MLAPALEGMTGQVLEWEHAEIAQLNVASGEILTPENVRVPERISHGGELIDLYNCLRGGVGLVIKPSFTALLDAGRGCIATVWHNSPLASVVGGLLANLKTTAEVRDLVTYGNQQVVITVRPPLTDSRLKTVDWAAVAGPRLGCDSDAETVLEPVLHDITGDGVPDSFVTLDCYTGDNRYPTTVLVYDGASSPAAPTLIGDLEPDIYLSRGGCFTFGSTSVTVHGRNYRPQDPAGAPSLLISHTHTWTGSAFSSAAPKVSEAPDDLSTYPGCD